jgi:glycosyltransferase involved in cell wall biosynthesis
MSRLPITVCMISGAEERGIGRALASVADWTSEVIVVINDDVADRTEEICRAHGATVFRERWKGYLGQTASAASKGSQPWQFTLDADEAVTPELRAEIEAVFADARRLESHSAWSMPRRLWFMGRWLRHGDSYPDRKTRLWKRGRGVWGGAEPHYRLTIDGSTGRLHGDLLHYGVESIGAQLAKYGRYAEVCLAREPAGGKRHSCFAMVSRPAWRFVRGYILRGGFLDGCPGFCFAVMYSISVFARYARILEAEREGNVSRKASC